jgi:dolichol-phosphate mannosyltransferase
MKKAILVIPTYNERGNIEALLEALAAVFKTISDWKMEVLIVDDTSPDKTYELVKSLTKKYSFLHLLVNAEKAGLGAAYIKGLDHAFDELGADVAFEFDADLSHDPSKIPSFLAKIDAGNDMVLGSRYIPGGGIPDDWGFHRKFLSVVGNIIITLVFTNFTIRDWTTGYRAFTKKVYQTVRPHIMSERFQGYTFQIGFLRTAMVKKFKIVEVPFKFVDRTVGESKLGAEYIKNNLIYIFKTRLLEIVNNRIFKFAFVGGVGALVQLLSLQLWRIFLPFQLAFFLSIETAVVSNFILNNLWTFADRKLEATHLPAKFIQFNLASAGSIVIQQVIALIGEFTIGLYTLFTLPFINLAVETGTIFAIVGIIIGMFWNFFAYNTFIWKKKKAD